MKGDEFGFAGLAGNIKNDGIKMKNEIVRLEELRVKIIEWADEKGILKKATPEKQFLKFIEETGELAKAILKSDSHEFIDAVGDVFVTIVIHSKLASMEFGFDEDDSLDFFSRQDTYLFGSMVSGIDNQYHYDSINDLFSIYRNNEGLAEGKSFADCVEVAYNVIAGRTGKMVNGTFVKDK
jgi:NTP pyrophosphatase (non-canonical NTP hydrolase)